MTTTDPSSGSSAPRDTHVTHQAGDVLDVLVVPKGLYQAVGSIVSSSAHVIARAAYPDQEEAIDALVEKFTAFSDHHLPAAEAHPASYVGSTNLPEVVVGALAHSIREQRETERAREEAEKARHWSLIKDIVLLVVGGVLTLGLKALFFPPSSPP